MLHDDTVTFYIHTYVDVMRGALVGTYISLYYPLFFGELLVTQPPISLIDNWVT